MMYKKYPLLSPVMVILFTLVVVGCEDTIHPNLDDAKPVLVVDAWINDKAEPQNIVLSYSQAYFNNAAPKPLLGANVTLTENGNRNFQFIDQGNGHYIWTPQDSLTLKGPGNTYELTIVGQGNTYTSTTTMGAVPPIDSVTFTYEKANGVFDEQYVAEFWSRDLTGEGDTYWIRTYWNDQELNKPEEMNIAWDAGFSQGGGIDGFIFIPPIRQGITPSNEEDEDGNEVAALQDGDSLYVEIHSISHDAFRFLSELRVQIDRPGGFAELFAQPLSNIPTNISSSNSQEEVLGFFNVAAVKGTGRKLNANRVKNK
jgi:hypothetical protein